MRPTTDSVLLDLIRREVGPTPFATTRAIDDLRRIFCSTLGGVRGLGRDQDRWRFDHTFWPPESTTSPVLTIVWRKVHERPFTIADAAKYLGDLTEGELFRALERGEVERTSGGLWKFSPATEKGAETP